MAATQRALLKVRPDSKGRVTLGKLTQGVSGYAVDQQPDGSLLLKPLVELPASEAWLFKNPKALAAVREGLEDSASGRVRPFGSFAKYAHEDLDE